MVTIIHYADIDNKTHDKRKKLYVNFKQKPDRNMVHTAENWRLRRRSSLYVLFAIVT